MATLKNSIIDDSGYLKLPAGTVDQRPASPVAGMQRYNSVSETSEYYNGSSWVTSGIVSTGLALYIDAGNTASYPGTGTTWNDISGNGRNLTIYGSPVFNANGYFTLANNQATQYMMRYPFETPTGDITYSCWFRSNFANANQTPFTYSVAGNNEMLLFTASNTQIQPHPLGVAVTVNTSIMTHSWVNFAWTRQLSTGQNLFYRDGFNIGSYTASAGVAIGANGYLIIGQESDAAGGGFDANQNLDGDFAILKIYNRVLSPSEILQNFVALRGRFGV